MTREPPPFFNRGPAPAARLAFFVALSLAAMITDAKFHYLTTLRQALSVLIHPLQQVVESPYRLSSHVGQYFSDQHALIAENAALKVELLDQSARLQNLQSLKEDYDQLASVLDVRHRLAEDGVLVEIIATRRNPFNRRVTINKGANDRVTPGLAVIDGAGVVGQITAVNPFSSEITLITDKDQAVPVMVSRNGLRAIVVGAGRDGGLNVPFLPANADVRQGDVLVTSGIDGTYPPGLAVAKVSEIDASNGHTFSRITATPLAGVENHKYLLVLTRHPAVDYPKADMPTEESRTNSNYRKAREGKNR